MSPALFYFLEGSHGEIQTVLVGAADLRLIGKNSGPLYCADSGCQDAPHQVVCLPLFAQSCLLDSLADSD